LLDIYRGALSLRPLGLRPAHIYNRAQQSPILRLFSAS
jgi:hypothetical protein